jgi:hypothetical protein
MADPITLSVAVLALVISATTAWLTLFRRGTIKMTQPTVIFFGPDAPRGKQKLSSSKIFLRCLLFSTSKRGRVIESMHATLSRNETRQNFNVWVYGDDKLVRGSGLFVGESGISANHHFLTPRDGSNFIFSEGTYHLQVFARLLGDKESKLLFTQSLEIKHEISTALEEPGAGLYFDWGPDSSRYLSHIEKRPPLPDHDDFIGMLGLSDRSIIGADKPGLG